MTRSMDGVLAAKRVALREIARMTHEGVVDLEEIQLVVEAPERVDGCRKIFRRQPPHAGCLRERGTRLGIDQPYVAHVLRRVPDPPGPRRPGFLDGLSRLSATVAGRVRCSTS